MRMQLSHADTLRAQAAEASARAAEAERNEAVRAAVAAERARSEAELKKQAADLEQRIQAVTKREATLGAAIKKVMHAEEAMEACLTCMQCMNMLVEPTTCTPCGHTFCAECLSARGNSCPECDDGAPSKPFKVEMLGTLTSKFEFQKQVLESLSTTATTANAVSKFASILGR
jgi:nucleoid-associated protein YgaU